MSFLFPLYFLGALALAAPLLLHLRKRPPKDQTVFSSLMFLDKTPEKLTRRSKLEKLFLLALRCLVLLLLALMFARPFVVDQSFGTEASQGRRVVFLLDKSASMQREDLWSQANRKIEGELKSLAAGDEAAVIVFDEREVVVIGFEEWKQVPSAERVQLVMARLKKTTPSWNATAIGQSLATALELIGDRDAVDAASGQRFGEKEVVLISDFQEGSERDSLNRLAWPESLRLRNVGVNTKGGSNFSLFTAGKKTGEDEELDSFAEGDASGNGKEQQMVRVRVANSEEGSAEKFTLAWVDEGASAEDEVTGNVPPGGARVLMAPPRFNEAAAGILEIQGDDHAFDNRIYVGPTQARPVKILYLGEDVEKVDAGSPLFYLGRALRKTDEVDPLLESRRADEIKTAADLKGFDVVILAGGWDSKLGEKLAEFVKDEGGVVICSLADEIGSNEVEALTGLSGLRVSEAEVDDYAMLAGLDFDHPVMRPFAKAQVRDFSKIHFWKHRVLSLPDSARDSGQVALMASFDDGSPAWVDVRQEKGRVYLMMSGWEPEESQLALSSKFVPLLYSILSEAGFSAVKAPPVYVGGSLPVASAKSVVVPGETEAIELESGQQVFTATDRPGFYTVISVDGKGVQSSRVHAVNLAPSESRVDAFDAQILADFGIKVQGASGNAGGEAGAVEEAEEGYRLEQQQREGRQKAWKWIVLAMLLVLWLESWVAGRVGRTGDVEPEAA